MNFPVKFIGLGLFFPITSTLVVNSKNHLHLNAISNSELDKKFAATKSLKKVSLSSQLDPNVSIANNAPSIYSLFSTNLKTFSESFNRYFSQKIVYKWALKLLSSADPNSFFNIKSNLKTIIDSSTTNPISDFFEKIKGEFNSLFFKNFYENENFNQYGDMQYVSSVKKFQDFLYDYWKNQQKPVLLCKKSWDFSPNTTTLYNSQEGQNKASYEYPEFETSVAADIKKFYDSNVCSQKTLFTRNELLNYSNSREISALLELLLSNKYQKLVNLNKDNLNINTPWDIFVVDDVDEENKGSLVEINKTILKDSKELKEQVKDSSKKYYLLDIRKVKFPANQQTFGTFVKSPSGISFFTVHTVNEWKTEADLPENFKLMDSLKDFFWRESGKILGSFYNKNPGEFSILFKTLDDDSSEFELFKHTSKFSEVLDENKKLFKLTSVLSSASNKYLNSNSPKGLEIPLYEKRSLDNSTEIKSDFSKDALLKNNGLFDNLNEYFDFKDPTLLSETAKTLKKSLALAISNLNTYTREGKWFFNNYVFDGVLSDFYSNNQLVVNTQKAIFLLNDLKFDHVENNVSEIFSDHFQNAIKEIFIWKNYNDESLEVRSSYGGWKNSTGGDGCFLSRDSLNSASDSCGYLKKNNSQFLIRLNNYWLMKNYVFNEYGYEVGSSEFYKYIQYLFSIKYLSQNNFLKLRKYISESIPKNEFGVLLWVNSIENIENLTNKADIGAEQDEQLKNKTKYFQYPNNSPLFSKWLNSAISSWTTTPNNQSSDLPSAYAKTDVDRYTLFHGFKGLITSKSGSELKNLFSNLDKYIPLKTKNYSSAISESNANPGLAFGIYLGEDRLSMENLIDSFDSIENMKIFLKTHFKDEYQSLLSSLSNLENSEADANINIQVIKKTAKSKLNNIDKSKLRTLLSRFSGFIKNPNISESIHSDKPYFIPIDESGSSSDKGSIMYITQVNKYDMGEGFASFIRDITPLTFIKLLSHLPSDPKIANHLASEYVSSKYVV